MRLAFEFPFGTAARSPMTQCIVNHNGANGFGLRPYSKQLGRCHPDRRAKTGHFVSAPRGNANEVSSFGPEPPCSTRSALRQAAQGRGRPGGAERRDESRRPRKGARGQGFRAQTLGPGIRGDGRCRLSRQRKPQGQQGLRDREAQEEGRGARARERAAKKFPGLLGSRPCARCGLVKAHRGEFGPVMRAGINIVGTRGLRTKI